MPRLSPSAILLCIALSIAMGVSFFWPPLLLFALLGWMILIVLMVVDYFVTSGPEGLKIERKIAKRLSLGDPNPVEIEVRNIRKQKVKGIIAENVPVEWQMRDVEMDFSLDEGGKAVLRYSITPVNRGAYLFKDISLQVFGMLGLIRKRFHVKKEELVKVYPSYMQFKKYQLFVHKANLAILGKKKQRKYGEGREFESLREYTPDDEYKKINWKATARRGKPIVTQYQMERNQNILILLDAGRMMRTEAGEGMSRLDYAVNTALMLSYVCVNKEDNVGLLLFNSQIREFLPPKRGKEQLSRINEALYNIRIEVSEPNYTDAFQFIRKKVTRRSLIVLITDIIDRRASRVLISEFASLYPQHLPLIICLKDEHLYELATPVPATQGEMLEMSVAQGLLDERLTALSYLRKHGVLTMETFAGDLTADVVNKYLEIKARSLI